MERAPIKCGRAKLAVIDEGAQETGGSDQGRIDPTARKPIKERGRLALNSLPWTTPEWREVESRTSKAYATNSKKPNYRVGTGKKKDACREKEREA